MPYTSAVSADFVQQWLADKRSVESVQDELMQSGLDPDFIQELLMTYRKLVHARRQTAGFLYMGIGAFLGFVSCVLTLVNPVPELYNWILYGLTSVAIGIIFVGLYFVFE